MIRIGIVDDEKQERDQLKQALARFGAENGTELNVQEFDCAAVYLAAQDRDFDILYLDIDMPQMSGMELAEKIRMIANHGQKVKYHHSVLGCNSRLDTLQAAILDVKLKHLDEYGAARYKAAQYYTRRLSGFDGIITPAEMPYSTHVYHQYTLKVLNGRRDVLKKFLEEGGIPAMIYYPLPLQEQEVMRGRCRISGDLNVASRLSRSVLSLPIHTEMTEEEQAYIIESIKSVL